MSNDRRNTRRIAALRKAASEVLYVMTCQRCGIYRMGCPECMGTGFSIASDEDNELVKSAMAVIRATDPFGPYDADDQPVSDGGDA